MYKPQESCIYGWTSKEMHHGVIMKKALYVNLILTFEFLFNHTLSILFIHNVCMPIENAKIQYDAGFATSTPSLCHV